VTLPTETGLTDTQTAAAAAHAQRRNACARACLLTACLHAALPHRVFNFLKEQPSVPISIGNAAQTD
jgi:hypothetical protein